MLEEKGESFPRRASLRKDQGNPGGSKFKGKKIMFASDDLHLRTGNCKSFARDNRLCFAPAALKELINDRKSCVHLQNLFEKTDFEKFEGMETRHLEFLTAVDTKKVHVDRQEFILLF